MTQQRGVRAFAALLTFAAAACGQTPSGSPEAEPPPPPQEILELLGDHAAAACFDITMSHDFPTEANGLNPYEICVADLNAYIESHNYHWPGPGIASNVNTPQSHADAAARSILQEFEGMDLVIQRSPEGGDMLKDIMNTLQRHREQIEAVNPSLVLN